MTNQNCIDCGGEGFSLYKHWGPYAWSSDDPDSPDAGHWTTEKITCRTCNGSGQLSNLAMAVRKARGGPPPPEPARTFA